jgi:hypothetical protein
VLQHVMAPMQHTLSFTQVRVLVSTATCRAWHYEHTVIDIHSSYTLCVCRQACFRSAHTPHGGGGTGAVGGPGGHTPCGPAARPGPCPGAGTRRTHAPDQARVVATEVSCGVLVSVDALMPGLQPAITSGLGLAGTAQGCCRSVARHHAAPQYLDRAHLLCVTASLQ